jgi:hypothetical protein
VIRLAIALGAILVGIAPPAAAARSAESGSERLAYIAPANPATGQRASLWAVDADGTQRLRLLHGFPGFLGPVLWSPDGRQLAVATCRTDAGTCQGETVLVVGADGRNVGQVAQGDYVLVQWSPTGDGLLVFHPDSPQQSLGTLSILQLNGKLRAVATAAAEDGSWSPDGKHVLYQRGSELSGAPATARCAARNASVPISPVASFERRDQVLKVRCCASSMSCHRTIVPSFRTNDSVPEPGNGPSAAISDRTAAAEPSLPSRYACSMTPASARSPVAPTHAATALGLGCVEPQPTASTQTSDNRPRLVAAPVESTRLTRGVCTVARDSMPGRSGPTAALRRGVRCLGLGRLDRRAEAIRVLERQTPVVESRPGFSAELGVRAEPAFGIEIRRRVESAETFLELSLRSELAGGVERVDCPCARRMLGPEQAVRGGVGLLHAARRASTTHQQEAGAGRAGRKDRRRCTSLGPRERGQHLEPLLRTRMRAAYIRSPTVFVLDSTCAIQASRSKRATSVKALQERR